MHISKSKKRIIVTNVVAAAVTDYRTSGPLNDERNEGAFQNTPTEKIQHRLWNVPCALAPLMIRGNIEWVLYSVDPHNAFGSPWALDGVASWQWRPYLSVVQSWIRLFGRWFLDYCTIMFILLTFGYNGNRASSTYWMCHTGDFWNWWPLCTDWFRVIRSLSIDVLFETLLINCGIWEIFQSDQKVVPGPNDLNRKREKEEPHLSQVCCKIKIIPWKPAAESIWCQWKGLLLLYTNSDTAERRWFITVKEIMNKIQRFLPIPTFRTCVLEPSHYKTIW